LTRKSVILRQERAAQHREEYQLLSLAQQQQQKAEAEAEAAKVLEK
jgi:hypothetical protein